MQLPCIKNGLFLLSGWAENNSKGERDRMRYTDEWIDRVRNEADILQVVSDHIALHKKGNRYWGLCPFHGEKTPSFSVAPDKGFYYCFGCQSGGNAFQFLMQLENISFGEAAQKLAQRFGVALPEVERSPEEAKKAKLIGEIWLINQQAAKYFHACLNHETIGKNAREYLERRGITKEIQEKFQLGYSPNSWQHISDVLKKKGISDDSIEAAGLVGKNKRGGLYERFRGRLMFPILDPRGRYIGFGGRLLEDKEGEAKYLNSPETVLFNKRHQLYGLNLALDEIKKTKKVFVVEGYMDLIALHKAGCSNSVASLGTAFTSQQGRLIQRVAEEVIFAYDSDSAGQNATVRALQVVRELGMKLRILDLPDGKDPDEFIRTHGAEAFAKLEGKPLLEYQVNRIIQMASGRGQEERQEAVRQAVVILSESVETVEIEEEIRKIASQLQLDEGVLRQEIRRSRRKTTNPSKKIIDLGAFDKNESGMAKIERQLLYLLKKEASLPDYVKTQINIEDFSSLIRGKLFSLLINNNENFETILLSSDAEEESREWYRIEGTGEFFIGDLVTLVDGLIFKIRLESLHRQSMEASERASKFEKEGNEKYLQETEKSGRILQEIQLLKKNRPEGL